MLFMNEYYFRVVQDGSTTTTTLSAVLKSTAHLMEEKVEGLDQLLKQLWNLYENNTELHFFEDGLERSLWVTFTKLQNEVKQCFDDVEKIKILVEYMKEDQRKQDSENANKANEIELQIQSPALKEVWQAVKSFREWLETGRSLVSQRKIEIDNGLQWMMRPENPLDFQAFGSKTKKGYQEMLEQTSDSASMTFEILDTYFNMLEIIASRVAVLDEQKSLQEHLIRMKRDTAGVKVIFSCLFLLLLIYVLWIFGFV